MRRELEKRATKHGVPIAEVVRHGLYEYLGIEKPGLD